jgi:hypothetical protein
VKRLLHPAWVIALLLFLSLLMAGGGGSRERPAWPPVESRATDGAAREAAQDCPARARAIVHDA